MKLPSGSDKISFLNYDRYNAFPPYGFRPFEEGHNGAGDYYGLYWELGKENCEPMVFFMNHEEGYLLPEFPTLSAFLANYNPQTEQVDQDPSFSFSNFYPPFYHQSRVKARKDIPLALNMLKRSTHLFGEFSASWFLLSKLLSKEEDKELKEKSAIKAFVSNWQFESPWQEVLDHLQSIRFKTRYKNDPLVKRVDDLAFSKKQNNFKVYHSSFLNLVEAYKEINDFHSHIMMYENYGFMMENCSRSQQKEVNFSIKEWNTNLEAKIREHYPSRLLCHQ